MSRQTLAFQAESHHFAMVHDAAQKAGLTVADYLRRVVLEWAAADLGQGSPDLSVYAPDLVAQAAKKLGMSPREFSHHAARELAAQTLGATTRAERSTTLLERRGNGVIPTASEIRRAASTRK